MDAARARWRGFLERWYDGAADRERDHTLLFDAMDELRLLRFGAIRLPRDRGGEDRSLAELFTRLVELAETDSNLAHVWRGHIAFVEGLRLDGWGTAEASRWAPRIAAGQVVGNAFSERQETAELRTSLRHEGGALVLDGTKHYTTGSLYADWIHVAALDGDERVSLAVPAHAPGVRIVDDWDGIGQPLTGSGTTVFEQVVVDPREIERRDRGADAARRRAIGAIYQLSLLAVVAGIGRRAVRDTAAFVVPRRRTFGFAGETPPREDPLVQHVVGEVSAAASVARRVVIGLAADLEAATDAAAFGDATPLAEVELEVYRAQHVVGELVLAATSRLFEVGGASAVTRAAGLDRHWRNVRTIASHNPVAQRLRAVGAYELTGEHPQWAAPGAPAEARS
ncbi:acyl-CoA dehydrogenase family protein [Microbacterium sp. SORGH_AS_0888]|uniref:acyl-CoA dehydrogenase family protein n=1 Tax=Microbacterium sp. SORGH_AS_0888 TaxID=3041791 RepID=UPI002784E1B0|nr:acyl-CoA dehydrogenase family protein [Microbacterium sp. SORGH_AS_0888]MDQ1130510.1 alkylation response protein AidB-like acyl-CoA dehydrogenase [Microbacterium sp. SORGH_AS_0888]